MLRSESQIKAAVVCPRPGPWVETHSRLIARLGLAVAVSAMCAWMANEAHAAVPTAPVYHSDNGGAPPMEWSALGPLSAEVVEAMTASQGDGRLLQIGIGRSLGKPLRLESVAPESWVVHPNGWRSYAFGLVVAGALGMRVHLVEVNLPGNTRALVYDPAQPETTTRELTRADLDEQGSAWSPTVFAERVNVEVQVPPEVDAAQVRLTISEISHLYRAGDSGGPRKLEGPCHQDVSCYPAFEREARAVARMTFIQGGSTLVCSGALVESARRSETYFLTAHHCVADQGTASTIELFWFYETDRCNGEPPELSSVPVTTGGAELVASSEASDFTLLRLRRSPPSGATRLEWSADPPQVGEQVVTIHHPEGSFKRLSTGRVVGVDPAYVGVQWNSGATEDGSSGGPLLNSRGQLLGQLDSGYHGPGSSCADPGAPDQFGRFDVTFQSVRKWLSNDTSGGGFPALNATYNGLLYPAGGVDSAGTAGYFTLRTTTQGKLSGKLRLGASTVSFSGTLDANGYAHLSGRARGTSLSIEIQIDPANPDRVDGTVSDGSFLAQLAGDRAVFSARNRAPQAGRYTVVLPGEPGSWDSPGGDSFGTVSVDTSGRIKFAGTMADGTKVSQSTMLSPDAQWPLFAPLYSGRGVLMGWIHLGDGNGADLSGEATWLKAGGSPGLYGGGFYVRELLVGSAYTRPGAGTEILSLDETAVRLQGGGLAEELWNPVTLDGRGRVIDHGEHRLRLSFSPSTGSFKGTIQDPESARSVRLNGVVLQRFNTARGFFAIPGNGSGRVIVGD